MNKLMYNGKEVSSLQRWWFWLQSLFFDIAEEKQNAIGIAPWCARKIAINIIETLEDDSNDPKSPQ